MHINDDTRAELAKRKIGHLKKILCHFLEKFTTRTFIHIKRERESFRVNYTNNNFTTTFCIKLTTTFFTGAYEFEVHTRYQPFMSESNRNLGHENYFFDVLRAIEVEGDREKEGKFE